MKSMRMYTTDTPRKVIPLPTKPCKCGPTKDADGPVTRTEVARFNGDAYVAEREGNELVVYLVATGPLPTMTIGDGFHSFNAKIQRKAEEIQRRNEEMRRKVDQADEAHRNRIGGRW